MERGFDALFSGYKSTLGAVLKHHYIMAVVFFGVIRRTNFLFGRVSKDFVPVVANDSMNCTAQVAVTEGVPKHVGKSEKEVSKLRVLQAVTTELQSKTPQVNVGIDRGHAEVLGLTATQTERAPYSAFGQRWTSSICAPTKH